MREPSQERTTRSNERPADTINAINPTAAYSIGGMGMPYRWVII